MSNPENSPTDDPTTREVLKMLRVAIAQCMPSSVARLTERHSWLSRGKRAGLQLALKHIDYVVDNLPNDSAANLQQQPSQPPFSTADREGTSTRVGEATPDDTIAFLRMLADQRAVVGHEIAVETYTRAAECVERLAGEVERKTKALDLLLDQCWSYDDDGPGGPGFDTSYPDDQALIRKAFAALVGEGSVDG